MATPTIPSNEPASFAAGETQQWTRSFADYPPSDGWTLTYYFAGPDTFQVSGAADATNTGYTVLVASRDTKAKPAGVYRWRAYAEKGSDSAGTLDRRLLDIGSLTLEPNLATANATEQQVFAEQMVAAIKARLLGRTNADLESYGVAGKSAVKIPYAQLQSALGIWQAKLWRAQNPGRLAPTVAVRFTPVQAPANDQWDGQP